MATVCQEYLKNKNGEIFSPIVSSESVYMPDGSSLADLKMLILMAENPVGHIRYEGSDINPAEYLGFGTWQLWGQGQVPVGVNSNDADFNEVDKTGGEKTHQLTEAELPHLTGQISQTYGDHYFEGATGIVKSVNVSTWCDGISKSSSDNTSLLRYSNGVGVEFGGDQPHNNMPPYFTCYIWKRIS